MSEKTKKILYYVSCGGAGYCAGQMARFGHYDLAIALPLLWMFVGYRIFLGKFPGS